MLTVPSDATEGDVETHLVLPLLTRPEYLDVKTGNVRSKTSIAPRDIGKGKKKRVGYVPDFCVYAASLPVLIVEAKSTAKDVHEAYGEGRLYASEINSAFPAGLNPCCRILATNGAVLLAGAWDAQPALSVQVSELVSGNPDLDRLITLLGRETLEKLAAPISEALRSDDFRRASSVGTGPAQIASRIQPNTFAADLTPVLRRYFSSKNQATDPDIYSRAYISSNEVTSYDRILESFLKDRLSKSSRRTEITTSRRKANEITKTISQFDEKRPFGGDLQLVTGGVGVGKSLFARRYKEFLQPAVLASKNHWAFINFISPPEDFGRWNDWVCEKFVESLAEEGAPFDIRQAADQERIFSSDLADRNAYYDRMEAVGIGRGELERARDIEQWRFDALKLTKGISRYLQGDRGDNLIVVFDNVDRREAKAQLAAFQTALWFMDQTRSMVILQMRDSTFEAYKHESPIDTYRTGQIFHISPPRFVDVVKRRLELSLDHLAKEAPEQIRFKSTSGIAFSYPKSRSGVFLTGIYNELFQRPNNVSRVLEALAGRNVRRALDMFFAIVTSGHMPDDVIASVAQGTGFRGFPEYITLRALIRQDYRFFNNNSGFVANIFYCDTRWKRPSNLIIPEILYFLISQRKIRGDNGQTGFVALSRLLSEMEALGFVREDVFDAARFCLSKELIEVDTSSLTAIRDQDSLKASASGWAHMRLLAARLEYVHSVLPTTPVNDPALLARVADLMHAESRSGQLPFYQAMQVVQVFENYLREQAKSLDAHPGFFGRVHSGTRYVIAKVQEALSYGRRDAVAPRTAPDALDA